MTRAKSQIVVKNGKKEYRSQILNPVTGRRESIRCSTEAELLERIRRIRDTKSDLKHGILTPKEALLQIQPAIKHGQLTVEQLFVRFVETQTEASSPLCRQNWEHRLSCFAKCSPHELTREKVQVWHTKLLKLGVAPKTAKNSFDHLTGAIRLAVDDGHLLDLPWGRWRPPRAEALRKREAVGNIEDMVSLVMAAREHDRRLWNRGMFSDRHIVILVLLLTGLRQSEACGLSWDCTELDTAVPAITVRYQAKRAWNKVLNAGTRPRQPTKTRKSLTQVLHPNVCAALRSHRVELQRRGWYRDDGPVFPGNRGAWRTSGRVISPDDFRKIVEAAGIRNAANWVVHSTRHSFATLELIASGGDFRRTMDRTGHTEIKTLLGYLHAAGGNLSGSAIPGLVLPTGSGLLLGDGSEVICSEKTVIRDGQEPDPWGLAPANMGGAPQIMRADYEEAHGFHERRAADKHERDREAKESFTVLAAKWIQSPEYTKAGVPKAVNDACDGAYMRAYMRKKRSFGKIELTVLQKRECQKAGKTSKRQCLGAWKTALNKILKGISTT